MISQRTKISPQKRILRNFLLTPSAILLMEIFALIFSLGGMLSFWIPRIGVSAFFPEVDHPYRAILCLIIAVFVISSFFSISDYGIPIVYFMCGVRIADGFLAGPLIAAILYTVAALFCTYAMARKLRRDKIFDEREKERNDEKSH